VFQHGYRPLSERERRNTAKFDLRLFNINGDGGNGFPQDIIDVVEQKNYLETLIRTAMKPTRVFRPTSIGADDWFQGRIGETKTFTRNGLIAPSVTPLNPANNTGLDNGMTAVTRAYEQWTATLNEYPQFIPTNILGQEAFIADLFENNMETLGQMAGDSMEMLCLQRIINAYDAGDTFAVAALTGSSTSIHVDNINGFSMQYVLANLPSLQAPVPVSSTNYIPVAIINSSGDITALVNVTAATPDGSNISIMQTPSGVAFGASGVLTLSAGVTCALGDRVVALDLGAASAQNPPTVGSPLNPVYKDGSVMIRPLNGSGVQYTTANALPATALLSPSQMIPAAVAVLKRRNAPKLANGLYGCAIDSTLLSQLYNDTGFQRASATTFDGSPVFADGVVAKGWGVEFTEATQLPVYENSSAVTLRHFVVFGKDIISEHPFTGAKDAAATVSRVGDVAIHKWVERIKFRALSAIDTLGQVIKYSYDYVGDFQPGTDKLSNPAIVLTSDYCRYKRGVVGQCAAPY
jgi:hypothetical protein